MKRTGKRLALGVLAAVVCLWALMGCGGEDTPYGQVVEMRRTEYTESTLGYGNSQWLYPLTAPKETLAAEPKYGSKTPVYYAAVYGDSEDKTFTFVIDESGGTGKGYDTLYVDANNDNRIEVETERFAFRLGTTSVHYPIRLTIQVSSGGRTAPYSFNFTAFPYTSEKHPQEKIHATLRNSSYYVGEATFGGKPYTIAIADLNSNGLFNDPEPAGSFSGDRFFVDRDGSGKFYDDPGRDTSAGFGYGGYTKIDGSWYTIVARPDGGEITISPATPALGLVEAPETVARAYLGSKTQPCSLNFSSGPAQGAGNFAQGVAGTYQVRAIALEAHDAEGRSWQTSASFPKDARPEVTIRENQAVQLNAGGPPLRVEPKISRKADADAETLEIGLDITGSAGETYRWSGVQARTVKPGFEVRDGSGRVLVSASLRYG